MQDSLVRDILQKLFENITRFPITKTWREVLSERPAESWVFDIAKSKAMLQVS